MKIIALLFLFVGIVAIGDGAWPIAILFAAMAGVLIVVDRDI